MVDGLTPEYLRHRARYWRNRAARETDTEKQIWFRETAAILEREAEALERQSKSKPNRDQPT